MHCLGLWNLALRLRLSANGERSPEPVEGRNRTMGFILDLVVFGFWIYLN